MEVFFVNIISILGIFVKWHALGEVKWEALGLSRVPNFILYTFNPSQTVGPSVVIATGILLYFLGSFKIIK